MEKVIPPHMWPEEGECFRQADPELFFPAGEKGQLNLRQIEAAKSYCRRCAMADYCLKWALTHEDHGVWGNTSVTERRAIKRRQGQSRPKIA